MTNTKQRPSEDAFERLASGRSARPVSACSGRRETTPRTPESGPIRPTQTIPSNSVPSRSPLTPSEVQANRRLRSAVTAQHSLLHSPQSPGSPTGDVSKLSQRRLEILEAQNERLLQQVQQLQQEQEERDGVAASAEAIILQLQGQVEAILDGSRCSEQAFEDRVLTTEACHKLRRLCKASLGRLKQTLRTAAEASSSCDKFGQGHTRPSLPREGCGLTAHQDEALGLKHSASDVIQQIHSLAPSLLQLSVTLRTDVLPSLRGVTASSKNVLLAECAAAAQCCCDVAEKSLQMMQHTHDQAVSQPSRASCKVSRPNMAAKGQRMRQHLAARARAASSATSSAWEPHFGRFLEQCSEKACMQSNSCSSELQACEDKVARTVGDSLRATAARADANERFIQDLAAAVEEVIQRHETADSAAADAAVEGIGRFLEFARTAHRRPNESSIKQLVIASRVCGPAIEAAQELLAHQDSVSVKAGIQVRSRLGGLRHALDRVLSTTAVTNAAVQPRQL